MKENVQLVIFKHLFRELWLQSNNCQESIFNIWFLISEVTKLANKSSKEIMKYFNVLIEENLIEITQKEPLQYSFTEKGKQFKNERDIESLLKKVI